VSAIDIDTKIIDGSLAEVEAALHAMPEGSVIASGDAVFVKAMLVYHAEPFWFAIGQTGTFDADWLARRRAPFAVLR